ncbi:Ribosomal silencing factor RsfS [Neolewinella maritima]|uniref:Ribosomal silencing factor RsfS n=1 Tax=Neolewinella maritima TaxID=1383882 RepID=A0ABM9AY09_9BACT|nr:ribosome silencing factor [Neolewinella maritima]CAH0999606.1 Ribosomal silencing factor RsfS [Neolewinella maritima]
MTTSTTTTRKTVSPHLEQRLDVILDSIQDIKGKNITRLDLRKLDDRPAEFFFICEGDSTTQVRAIAENIHRRMKHELGELTKNPIGSRPANWVCLDYFDTVVHVFYPETRAYYQIEDLWSDAIATEYESL